MFAETEEERKEDTERNQVLTGLGWMEELVSCWDVPVFAIPMHLGCSESPLRLTVLHETAVYNEELFLHRKLTSKISKEWESLHLM